MPLDPEALQGLEEAPPSVALPPGAGQRIGQAAQAVATPVTKAVGFSKEAIAMLEEPPRAEPTPAEIKKRAYGRAISGPTRVLGNFFDEMLYGLETNRSRLLTPLGVLGWDVWAAAIKGEPKYDPKRWEARFEGLDAASRIVNTRSIRKDLDRFKKTQDPKVKERIVQRIRAGRLDPGILDVLTGGDFRSWEDPGSGLDPGLVNILENGDFRRIYAELDAKEEADRKTETAVPAVHGLEPLLENQWRVPKQAIQMANWLAPGGEALARALPSNPTAQLVNTEIAALGAGNELARQLGKPVEELTWGDVAVNAADKMYRASYPIMWQKLGHNLPDKLPPMAIVGGLQLNPRRIVSELPITVMALAGAVVGTTIEVKGDPQYLLAATGTAAKGARALFGTAKFKANLAAERAAFEAAGGLAGATERVKLAKLAEKSIPAGPDEATRKPLTKFKPGETPFTPAEPELRPEQGTLPLTGEAAQGAQVRRAPPPGPVGGAEQPYPPTPELAPVQEILGPLEGGTHGKTFTGPRNQEGAFPERALSPAQQSKFAQVPAENVLRKLPIGEIPAPRAGFHPQAGAVPRSIQDLIPDVLDKAGRGEKLGTADIRFTMEQAKSWRESMLQDVAEVDQPEVMQGILNDLESTAASVETSSPSLADALRRSRTKLGKDWLDKMNTPAPKAAPLALAPEGPGTIELPPQMDPAGPMTEEALSSSP